MEHRERIIDPETGEHLGTVVFPDSSNRFDYYLLEPDEPDKKGLRYHLLRAANAVLRRVNAFLRGVNANAR